MPIIAKVAHRRGYFKPVRIVLARPRLFICFLLSIITGLVLSGDLSPVLRLLIAWNVGVLCYLAAVWHMMRAADHHNIRQRALVQDEGQFFILLFAVIAAAVSLGAIILQLGAMKEVQGLAKGLHILLVALTIVNAFAFIHIMFTLHYAHEFYAEWRHDTNLPAGERGGLMFPGTNEPNYVDFFYFAFVIGVASQTADVSTVSRPMRTLAVLHGIISFFFNTTVLALTINIAAGLI